MVAIKKTERPTRGGKTAYTFGKIIPEGKQDFEQMRSSFLLPEEHFIWEYYPDNANPPLRATKGVPLDDDNDVDNEIDNLAEEEKKGMVNLLNKTRKFYEIWKKLPYNTKRAAISVIVKRYPSTKRIFDNYKKFLSQSAKVTKEQVQEHLKEDNSFGDGNRTLLTILNSHKFFGVTTDDNPLSGYTKVQQANFVKLTIAFLNKSLANLSKLAKENIIAKDYSENDFLVEEENESKGKDNKIKNEIRAFLLDPDKLEDVFILTSNSPQFQEKFLDPERKRTARFLTNFTTILFKELFTKTIDLGNKPVLLKTLVEKTYEYARISSDIGKEILEKEDSIKESGEKLFTSEDDKKINDYYEANKKPLHERFSNAEPGKLEGLIKGVKKLLIQGYEILTKNCVEELQKKYHTNRIQNNPKEIKNIIKTLCLDIENLKKSYAEINSPLKEKVIEEKDYLELMKLIFDNPDALIDSIYEIAVKYPNYEEDSDKDKKDYKHKIPEHLLNRSLEDEEKREPLTTEDILKQNLLYKFLEYFQRINSNDLKDDKKLEKSIGSIITPKHIKTLIEVITKNEGYNFGDHPFDYKDEQLEKWQEEISEYVRKVYTSVNTGGVKISDVVNYQRKELNDTNTEIKIADALRDPKSLINIGGQMMSNELELAKELPPEDRIVKVRSVWNDLSDAWSPNKEKKENLRKMKIYEQWAQNQIAETEEVLQKKMEYELEIAQKQFQNLFRKFRSEEGGFFSGLISGIIGNKEKEKDNLKKKMVEAQYQEMLKDIMSRFYAEYQKYFQHYMKLLDIKRKQLGLTKFAKYLKQANMLNISKGALDINRVSNKVVSKINSNPSDLLKEDIKYIVKNPKPLEKQATKTIYQKIYKMEKNNGN